MFRGVDQDGLEEGHLENVISVYFREPSTAVFKYVMARLTILSNKLTA